MSGIIIDLQTEALSNNQDILLLLRKAYLIARKLKLVEFEQWINQELNGYTDNTKIPKYRKVSGELKGWNPYHGWIPVILQNPEMESMVTNHFIDDSLPNLLNLFEEGDSSYFILSFNGYANNLFSKSCGFNTKYSIHVSKSHLYNIFETVKTSILDWAITLEENGIIGEGLSFTEQEKEHAKNPTIYNYTNNFYGEAANIQIQQDTSTSSQTSE